MEGQDKSLRTDLSRSETIFFIHSLIRVEEGITLEIIKKISGKTIRKNIKGGKLWKLLVSIFYFMTGNFMKIKISPNYPCFEHNQHLMLNLLFRMFILGTLYPKLTNKSISCFHLWGLDSTTLGWVFMDTLHFPMHRNSFPNIHWYFQLRIGHVTLIRHLLHHFIPDVKLANSMAMKKMRTLRRSPEFISGKQNSSNTIQIRFADRNYRNLSN